MRTPRAVQEYFPRRTNLALHSPSHLAMCGTGLPVILKKRPVLSFIVARCPVSRWLGEANDPGALSGVVTRIRGTESVQIGHTLLAFVANWVSTTRFLQMVVIIWLIKAIPAGSGDRGVDIPAWRLLKCPRCARPSWSKMTVSDLPSARLRKSRKSTLVVGQNWFSKSKLVKTWFGGFLTCLAT